LCGTGSDEMFWCTGYFINRDNSPMYAKKNREGQKEREIIKQAQKKSEELANKNKKFNSGAKINQFQALGLFNDAFNT
jgi:hypothetical protein